VAFSLATKEAVWLCQVLLDLYYPAPSIRSITIYGDNKPALSLTANPSHHSWTKHLAVPFHYVREQIANGSIKVDYIPTSNMPADGLTKPLTGLAFSKFVEMLGLLPVPLNSDGLQSGGVLESPYFPETLSSPPEVTDVTQETEA
jgi:hypothetical protein